MTNELRDDSPDHAALIGHVLALERLVTALLLQRVYDWRVNIERFDSYEASAKKLQQVVLSTAQHLDQPISDAVRESFGEALRSILDDVVGKAVGLDEQERIATQG